MIDKKITKRKTKIDENLIVSTVISNDIRDIEAFLEQYNVNIQNDWGNTPLWRAASPKSKEMYRLLINYGANLNIANKYDRTPKKMAELGNIL